MAFIYALCHPETGELRYIGKADSLKARLKSHLRDSSRKDSPVYRWIKKLGKEGLTPEMVMLSEAEDWASAERSAIKRAKDAGYRILNILPGGNQAPPDRKGPSWKRLSEDDLVYRETLRYFGESARFFDKRGMTASAERSRAIQAMIRSFDKGKRAKLVARMRELSERRPTN